MTDDRDICDRLEDQSIDGAIFLRINAAKEIRKLREYSSKQALDIVILGQEVGRLREALEKIKSYDNGFMCDGLAECQMIARAALAEQGDKP